MQEDNYRTGRQTRLELWIGIVLFVLLFLLGNLLAERKLAYTLGLMLGGGVAVGLVGHMHNSIERALLYDEETAKKKVKHGSMELCICPTSPTATPPPSISPSV